MCVQVLVLLLILLSHVLRSFRQMTVTNTQNVYRRQLVGAPFFPHVRLFDFIHDNSQVMFIRWSDNKWSQSFSLVYIVLYVDRLNRMWWWANAKRGWKCWKLAMFNGYKSALKKLCFFFSLELQICTISTFIKVGLLLMRWHNDRYWEKNKLFPSMKIQRKMLRNKCIIHVREVRERTTNDFHFKSSSTLNKLLSSCQWFEWMDLRVFTQWIE